MVFSNMQSMRSSRKKLKKNYWGWKIKYMSMRTSITRSMKKSCMRWIKWVFFEKKLHKRAFESELKYINNIKILNTMNHIHDNKVNDIAE